MSRTPRPVFRTVLRSTCLRWAGLAALLSGMLLSSLQAAESPIRFRVTIGGNANVPRITLVNESRSVSFSSLEVTIGDIDKNFDFIRNYSQSGGVSITPINPDSVDDGVRRDAIDISFAGFDPTDSVAFDLDLDRDGGNSGEDYRRVMFNNGDKPNSVVTVTATDGRSLSFTFPDGPADQSSYTFTAGPEKRILKVKSVTEAGGDGTESTVYVRKAAVKINDEFALTTSGVLATNIGSEVSIEVFEGETVEITAPQLVFRNIHGVDISDSVSNDPELIEQQAEERFRAIGISVNDVPQTADPTLYRFDVSNQSVVVVKWEHEYALTVSHDFSQTQSLRDPVTGDIYAGPLTSEAEGNPDPPAKKTWYRKGENVIANINGSVDDFSRGDLAIRYVVKAHRSYGPPNNDTSESEDANNRLAASLGGQEIDIRSDAEGVDEFPFADLEANRQQVPQFTMYGPGGIRYVWQLQYGIKVNVDDQAFAALPRIFTNSVGNTWVEASSLEGTFYFDPGTPVRVASAANENGPNSTALNGWINGDGYYFSSSGSINSSDGSLATGGPVTLSNGDNVGVWQQEVFDSNGRLYRALEIPQLRRPVRVIWRYGPQQIRVNATIGEFVFQNDTNRASIFTTQPTTITKISGPESIGNNEMAIWDPAAQRLYPLAPGQFRATWLPSPDAAAPVEVVVTVTYPSSPHYPHIANTPPVALDADPNDNFIFKELKYTENNAVVDASRHFRATTPGKTVLLFGLLQKIGRAEPREYLQVRVVDTKLWNAAPPSDGSAIIGQKITDPTLDGANLGTGFILFENARYNPNIYDPEKLEGIASLDVYDLGALRSSQQQKIVVNKDALPGPVIPVNLHPGAANTNRIVVVWYADPATHDEILWPHRARTYTPAWPTSESQGLGRIVIASQYGSESVNAQGNDQPVVPAIGSFAAQTTYNPSRLQQVQIYHQPNTNLAGYNPNEEHALMAPSLRFANVSPRPPAAYALRNNDLNRYASTTLLETGQPANYTSHPYVLVQFLDTADNEFKMKVYSVLREDANIAGYQFATQTRITPGSSGVVSASTATLLTEPYIAMEAGEPVIPFYPIGEVVGAAPPPQTFGINIKEQAVYWEDYRGSSWAVSGGEDAWFTGSFYYRLLADFWWPENVSGTIVESVENEKVVRRSAVPQVGDALSFLPPTFATFKNVAPDTVLADSFKDADVQPVKVLFLSEWPENPPVLKAGETLTFSGGEFRADNPFRPIIGDDGEVELVETPGLPGILAFATAEVVFDSLNPLADIDEWRTNWTARVAQVLDRRTVPLSTVDFPAELAPATRRTRVKEGKYVFNDLPASLQKRFRYDPLNGRLEMFGLVNDKAIGDDTLTAAPPAVYSLEPNIITEKERVALRELSTDSTWQTAVDQLAKLTRNPNLVDTDRTDIPDPSATDYRSQLEQFWRNYYLSIGGTPPGGAVPPPIPVADADSGYLVGLEPEILRDGNGEVVTIEDPVIAGLPRTVSDPTRTAPVRSFGPGLALVPNPGFLDPSGDLPEISYVTVVENNDPSTAGSPITLHVIQVDRRERYRGSIQTIASDNVFDENLVLRHTGDFGANADELFFEWYYRPDDGSLSVPPPDLLPSGQPNPWKLFPDDSGARGRARFQITLKGNPNAPEALLADTWWFVRYRHENDVVEGTNWEVEQPDGSGEVNFTWAGAGNSDPFNDFDNNGIPDFRAQLAPGWIKRVLDAVNPYEARIRDFEGEAPSTISAMITEFGQRFEGPVALNPAKNVIENVGLIELYETILSRGRALSIDLSRPVSTPAIANALQLASTRISDFYTLLGNEAYTDAQDPTIGFGSDSAEYGSLAPAVHAFQNQMSSLLEEELALLRGVDDFFARPVYNRLFWNFTKGEGEAAYALNYNLSDINQDGFIDEDDALTLYPQGHGDAWGHYLTAVRNQYDLLKHPFFNWVSRSEFYNLQDIVIKVDFLDERKFAQTAAARAKTGSEIVDLTYREKYVEDPNAQWQGYTDSNKDRSWGVQGWARRAGQGAYFDWVTANALLPSEHPNETLEGIQKVDRQSNSDIRVVSANLNSIQRTFDDANSGYNPLGLSGNVVTFDIDPTMVDRSFTGNSTHFDQIYSRAVQAVQNAVAIWDNANQSRNLLRKIGNSELEFRNKVFQEDLTYRNRLIKIFGKPYDGTIGPGRVYPAGYSGPDLLLYMYVGTREITQDTVPGPTTSFARFNASGDLTGGELYEAFENGAGGTSISTIPNNIRELFSPTFYLDNGTASFQAQDGLYAVDYTDLTDPKVALEGLTDRMPVTAAGYTFQAPADWGARVAVGELQILINKMLQQEAQIARAIGEWDGLAGDIGRTFRVINARINTAGEIRERNLEFQITKLVFDQIIKGLETAKSVSELVEETTVGIIAGIEEGVPDVLPTGGLAVSPGDALSAIGAGFVVSRFATKTTFDGIQAALEITKFIEEAAFASAGLAIDFENSAAEGLQNRREWLKELEDLVGDEPIKRIEVFRQIEMLRQLSEQYRALLDEGIRLIDEREAYNKRVAAQTQRNRYQDMTFRVARNHAMENYRAAFDLASRYTYLAAKAYDYETNLDPSDPGSPSDLYSSIVKARGLGHIDGGQPRMGKGGLSEALARMKANYEVLRGQLGFNNPQTETGKISLRTELFRILPKGGTQPVTGTNAPPLPSPGTDSDLLWRRALTESRVDDLWMIPEFRYYCRPFAAAEEGPQPGIVLKFGTEIIAGNNVFGKPLSGGDHAYDASQFATKIRSAGIWFSDYQSDDVLNDLPETPRVYLVPVGIDVMSIANSDNPGLVRLWSVSDQRIPVPLPATSSELDASNYIPLLDSLNGRLGEPRKFSSFRAYHNGADAVNLDQLEYSSRLIGRSVWNTQWMLIIPGSTLNSNPDEGLDRFVNQVSDIKLIFQTYGYSGN